MSKKPALPMYRAASWSTANDGEATERQPHLFYRAGDVDKLLDETKKQHAFERRRWRALEEFYLAELEYDAKNL